MTNTAPDDPVDLTADQQMRPPDELEDWLTDLRVTLKDDPPDWLTSEDDLTDRAAGLASVPPPSQARHVLDDRTSGRPAWANERQKDDSPEAPVGRHRAAG